MGRERGFLFLRVLRLDEPALRARGIVVLLRQSDRLGFVIADLHPQTGPLGRDAQRAVAELARQIERLPRRLLERLCHRVVGDRVLDRRLHVLRRPEVAVRRHQPLDALVRTVEVVGVDEKSQPPLTVREVGKHRPRQKFLPQRLPESFDLPKRHRVLWPALDVPDPLTVKLFLEGRGATPCRVLAPIVRQHFLRHAVCRDRPIEPLEHQLGLLVVRQGMPHHKPRVVVNVADQVQPLVPP